MNITPVPIVPVVPPDTSKVRYELREKGVYDRVTASIVLQGTPEWKEYAAWLDAGNAPAPLPTPPGPKVEDLRREKKALINIRRAGALSAGFTFDGNRYDSDPTALSNILARCTGINAGVLLPADFSWRTADNIDVPMIAKQVVQLGAAALAYTYACHKYSVALKAALAVAADPSTIDLDSGWPT